MIGERRRKGGSSASTIVRAMPHIRGALIASVMGADYGQPPARRPVRQFNGKHVVIERKSDVPDALILEIRRLHEQEGIKTAQIHQMITALGHHVEKSWVYKCTQYYNRAHLVPAPGAQPYLKGNP